MIVAAPAHAHTNTAPETPTTTLPARYVRIPQRLLTSALYRPLQIGIYSLAARLFLVGKAPVPLSAADILRYDPALSRGAAQRALSNLVAGGWLITSERTGQKTTYVPAWGRVNGTPLPWRIGALCLDRPRHVRAVCLDLRLLDLFLGKLTPQPQRAAVITRYVTAPLLALADVGSYALLLGGLPGTTPSLLAWNLARDEQPLPLPEDAAILARASQRRLFNENDTTLTARGLQKAGLIAPTTAADSAQPLFFVPPEVIADWPIQLPANLIEQSCVSEQDVTASQSHIPAPSASSQSITWESLGVLETQRESSPNPHGGGGGVLAVSDQAPAGADNDRPVVVVRNSKIARPPVALPNTATVRALAAINVLPDQIAELADTPLAVVRDAIRDGQARAYVRDLAAWVVTLLRAYRDQGWKISPPAPRADSPEALRAAFARYAAEQVTPPHQDPADVSAPQPPVLESPAHISTRAQLWSAVLATLKLQLTRQEFNSWIRPALLHTIEAGVATISVPNVRVKAMIDSSYRALLRDLLTTHTGEAVAVRVILHGA